MQLITIWQSARTWRAMDMACQTCMSSTKLPSTYKCWSPKVLKTGFGKGEGFNVEEDVIRWTWI